MATVPEVQIFDVKALTLGADSYPGIDQVALTRLRGPLVGIRMEGEEVPSAMERAGTDEIATSIQVTSRSLAALTALLDSAGGTMTFRGRNAGQGTDKVVTVTGCKFERTAAQFMRDGKASFSIQGKGVAISEDDAE